MMFSNLLTLRRILMLDAVASGATGVLLIAGADLLTGWLGLSAGLMRGAGLILVPYVAFVAWLALQAQPARGAVWLVVAANALWAVASVLILVSGLVAPTMLGVAFVIAQAAVVALLGELQAMALRAGPATARAS